MPNYHVCFWSGERAQIVGCDIQGKDDAALLDGFGQAGTYALKLRRRSLPALTGLLEPVEFAWLAFICGPAWLYVALSYWIAS